MVGECLLGDSDDLESVKQFSTNSASVPVKSEHTRNPHMVQDKQTSTFIMLLNFKKISQPGQYYVPEIIRVLRLPQPDLLKNNLVSCLNFGPYDNGYIVIGTTSGHLIVLDPKNFNRVSTQEVFSNPDEGVSNIHFDPTQMVFLGSSQGRVNAINIIP